MNPPFAMMRRTIAATTCIALIVGCAGQQKPGWNLGPKPKSARTTAKHIWQPHPTAMRIYPASRFVQDDQRIALEARIELLDEMNDPIKGAGRFRMELSEKRRPGMTKMDARRYSWDVPLLTFEQQKRFYDSVTRTYLFRLKMDEQLLSPGDMHLEVTFNQPGREPLKAQAVLNTDP